MPKNANSILKEILQNVTPSKKELKDIKKILAENLQKVKANIKKNRINADVFIGGSFAKGTMIKKDNYEVDVFIRFDRKYKDILLSGITEKLLQGIRVQKIHGSRDYFKAKIAENLAVEFVPVRRIKNPREAENITDLSYSHVNYIKKKIKSEKLLDEIRLAKAFCYANGSYGAESYVLGFSGYGLELLIFHYKSFLQFIRAMVRLDPKKKEVIDLEKHHKNKNHVLMDINAAKLQSPIILVDPTYKQRNVLAALSLETLRNFQKVCKDFLEKPSVNFFTQKVINIEKIKAEAINRGYEFVLLNISTNRQEGDIAGSKLLKFYRHLCFEISKIFDIKTKGFEYNKGKTARIFIVAEAKPYILINGPLVNQEKHVRRFRNIYKNVSVKNSRLYSKVKINTTLENFLKNWSNKHRKKMMEMGIIGFSTA